MSWLNITISIMSFALDYERERALTKLIAPVIFQTLGHDSALSIRLCCLINSGCYYSLYDKAFD